MLSDKPGIRSATMLVLAVRAHKVPELASLMVLVFSVSGLRNRLPIARAVKLHNMMFKSWQKLTARRSKCKLLLVIDLALPAGLRLFFRPERIGGAALAVIRKWIFAVAGVLWIAVAPTTAPAQGHPELEANARAALSSLEAHHPLAVLLAKRAVAILVFPEVTKAGFLIGGEYGNGVMFRGGRFAGHYNTAGVTYGLQARAQTFGYALLFMNERTLEALNAASGLQVGVGPSIVVLDQGKAKSLSSETLTSDAYAFVFGQQGLMAGVGLEGTKITKLNH
jgi:lipid-binding SYLF domain-containing protein